MIVYNHILFGTFVVCQSDLAAYAITRQSGMNRIKSKANIFSQLYI